jgi:CheY-like chemotaxis protein
MSHNQRKILIVDDCLEDRETYRHYLQRDNKYTYKILQAETGEEGLALCRQELPDAILLDYMLPDINGLEFLSELRSSLGNNDFFRRRRTAQGHRRKTRCYCLRYDDARNGWINISRTTQSQL